MSFDPGTPESNLAVSVRNVTKSFEIYSTPRERLKQFVLPRLRRLLGLTPRQYFKSFSALTDVSFDIRKGETVGIIGRNGAGKSTLLQILCGTLTPTSGDVQINGRVAALLELGAGFNGEFTGRENIYMNAGILGLDEAEIDSRFSDIVAFADIGEFLEQPVKTYSSGMFVRLAFAVAVHVDADILIVDEALSVGDVYFQAKCIGHMKRLMQNGVTVLFVSHDTSSVKALCAQAVYLNRGNVAAAGSTEDVVEAYYSDGIKDRQVEFEADLPAAESKAQDSQTSDDDADLVDEAVFRSNAAFHRVQNGKAEFMNVQLLDERGRKLEAVDFGQQVTLRMKFRSASKAALLGCGYHIRDRNGFDVIYSDTGIEHCHFSDVLENEIVLIDWTFKVLLKEGDYVISCVVSVPIDLSISSAEICDWVPVAVSMKVGRGKSLPIHAAAYWPNDVKTYRTHAESIAQRP